MNAKFEFEQKLIQNEGIEHARKQREASTIVAVATITCTVLDFDTPNMRLRIFDTTKY